MRKLVLIATFAVSSLMVTSAQAADSSTKITFAKGGYCNSFTGDVMNGKVFRLWVMANQVLVIRNIGDERINVAYVSGPNGRLDGNRYDYETSYITQRKGNHYMKVYGNSNDSSIEFCAY